MEKSNPYIAKPLLERFLRYVKIWTTSDAHRADRGIIPSTEQQRDFAYVLEKELHSLGIKDIFVSEHAYVYARIPATPGYENVPSIGFLAHMDTVPDVPGEHVNPQVIENYDGKPIPLKTGIILDPKEDRYLDDAAGQTIVTSDGTTLLGADDKAGIAAIMTAADILLNGTEEYKQPHGQIEIIFSPDEETGHGTDKIQLDRIQSKYCYTLDGGHIGELEIECFTAWKSDVIFNGVSRHTGTARPDMVNAITMAGTFVNLLPQNESPEATDNYLGFYAPMHISGHQETASVSIFLRDFYDESMERRKTTVEVLAKAVEQRFCGGSVEIKHTKQYQNMKKKIDENPEVADKLFQAAKKLGITPGCKPIRGGTDGSRLTEMGIPTPNIFTGGHNFHSRTEWASIDQMTYAVRMILELTALSA